MKFDLEDGIARGRLEQRVGRHRVCVELAVDADLKIW